MRNLFQEIFEIHRDVVFVRVIDDDDDVPPEAVLVISGGDELYQNEFHADTETFEWFNRVHDYLDECIQRGYPIKPGYYT